MCLLHFNNVSNILDELVFGGMDPRSKCEPLAYSDGCVAGSEAGLKSRWDWGEVGHLALMQKQVGPITLTESVGD